MSIIDLINKGWGWQGINAVELIDENEFGNIIFKSEDESYWRILPENPECIMIASNQNEFDILKMDDEFQIDWQMKNLVYMAKLKLGELEEGRKYCLKIPAFLGGEYEEENLGTVSQLEQISFSSDIAKQINDMPDGIKIKLNIE